MVRRTAHEAPPPQSTSPPRLKSDFQQNGTPSSWKSGYPRQWGSEAYCLPFGSVRIASASLSSDERLLAVAAGRDIYIFDVETFQLVEKLEGHTEEVGHVEFQPGPTTTSSGGHSYQYTLASDADAASARVTTPVIKIWHLDHDGHAHEKALPIAADAATQAAVQGALEAITLASPTASDSWTLSSPAAAHLSAAFSAAIKDASQMDYLSGQTTIPGAVIPGFGSSAFSPDGSTLLFTSTANSGAVGPRPRITAYDLATSKEKFHMEGHKDYISWTGFSPNGALIASSSWDSLLKVYSAADGTLLRDYGSTGGQNWAAAFSPDSKFIAVGSGVGSVFLWAVDDPQAFPITIDGFPGWIRSLSWSPDSQLLAAGSLGGKLVVFNPHTQSKEQVWEIDREKSGLGFVEIGDVKFLRAPREDEDGRPAGQAKGTVLAFDTGTAGFLLYDFASNTKCYWGPGKEDPWSPGYWENTIMNIAKKGWVGNIDQDGMMRFWDYPY